MVIQRAALALVLASGCTDEVIISPVIETALNPDAEAFSGLDRIEISIAHDGDDVDLASRAFNRGQTLEIAGVPFGDDLVIHLRGFVGTSQVAYGRTCAFKVDAETTELAPHVFFSRTQKFADTALVPAGRDGGGAVSLLGTGIFLGGMFDAAAARQIERFDPLTGELALVATVGERTGAVEALIGKSRVVLVGGKTGPTTGADFLEVIDPNNRERPLDDITDTQLGRSQMTATSLTDGRVVAIGGRSAGGVPVGTSTLITLIGALPIVEDLSRAVLAHPRANHTATRLGDDVGAPVLIVGGVDAADAPVAIAELFRPQSKDLALPATFAPAMIVPRSRHAAALMPDGSVLIIGGVDSANQMVKRLERYTREAGFVDAGMLADGLVDAAVTPMPNGRYLITGGRTTVGGPPTSTVYIALLTEAGLPAVVATDRLGVPRAGHQAAALCDGTVLVSGGAGAGATAERYNPPDVGRR